MAALRGHSRRAAGFLCWRMVLLIGWLALVGGPGWVQAEPEWGYALAHELMSPYCPGRTLSACPSERAAELRQWILLQEAAGATREEVVANLEARFGEQIYSAPAVRGWGLAAWALPLGALGLGALVVIWVLRRMVGRRDADSLGPEPDASSVAVSTDSSGARDTELERLVDAELASKSR